MFEVNNSLSKEDGLLYLSTALFAIAVIHTFLCHRIRKMAENFDEKSIAYKIFKYLGEVELVFLFWSLVFLLSMTYLYNIDKVIGYLNTVNYTESVFVFVIMCMSATKPILQFADSCLSYTAKVLQKITNVSYEIIFYLTILVLGPILGSFMTEPVSMTVVALILYNHFLKYKGSSSFKYATVGLLFVNVSIGGALTHFAAPPVLMVARVWNWDAFFMMHNFGWKSLLSIFISTAVVTYIFRKDIRASKSHEDRYQQRVEKQEKCPAWLIIINIIFIALSVYRHESIIFTIPLFILFLGLHDITSHMQAPLKIKESFHVGLFLAGLVTLGTFQEWWLKPFIAKLNAFEMFLGSTALTSVTDNAALTYLGTLVPNLPDAIKYALVAGALAGGGLTVIANAPNPAGYGILAPAFDENSIKPLKLFLAALGPTIITVCVFMFLPPFILT